MDKNILKQQELIEQHYYYFLEQLQFIFLTNFLRHPEICPLQVGLL